MASVAGVVAYAWSSARPVKINDFTTLRRNLETPDNIPKTDCPVRRWGDLKPLLCNAVESLHAR